MLVLKGFPAFLRVHRLKLRLNMFDGMLTVQTSREMFTGRGLLSFLSLGIFHQRSLERLVLVATWQQCVPAASSEWPLCWGCIGAPSHVNNRECMDAAVRCAELVFFKFMLVSCDLFMQGYLCWKVSVVLQAGVQLN